MTADAPTGLREDKKRRTRERIRTCALDLFARQGYRATTLEQVAAAADVAPRTLYRYFPSKETLVITDEDDELMLARFRRELAEQRPLEAVRRAFRAALLSEENDEDRLRRELIGSEPELQAALLGFVVELAERYAHAIAEQADDPGSFTAALSLTGAVAGIALTTVRWDRDGGKLQQLADFDAGLARLENGFGSIQDG